MLVPGVFPTPVQDFALSFVELHGILVSSVWHPVEVHLNSSMILWWIYHWITAQPSGESVTLHSFVSSTNLMRMYSTLLFRSLMKILNSPYLNNFFTNQCEGTQYMICLSHCQLPTVFVFQKLWYLVKISKSHKISKMLSIICSLFYDRNVWCACLHVAYCALGYVPIAECLCCCCSCVLPAFWERLKGKDSLLFGISEMQWGEGYRGGKAVSEMHYAAQKISKKSSYQTWRRTQKSLGFWQVSETMLSQASAGTCSFLSFCST